MPAQLELLTFEGKNGEDATVFLQSVKRVAFSQGRQRDDDWLCDYVETCLVGSALKWYASLSKDIQIDFYRLRLAIIDRFCSDSEPQAPAAAVPPAAAPPPPPATGSKTRRPRDSLLAQPAAPPAPAAGPPPAKALRRGRITVIRDDHVAPGYIGPERYNEVAKRTDCGRMASANDGLVVEWIRASTSEPALLKIIGGSDDTSYLGVTHSRPTTPNAAHFWALCYCDEGVSRPYPRSSPKGNKTKEAASKLWMLDETTMEVTALWSSQEGEEIVELRANTDGHLWLRSRTEASREKASKAFDMVESVRRCNETRRPVAMAGI